MIHRCSENFRKFSKKAPFCTKGAWKFTKRRNLLPVFPILENFWKWMTFDSCFWTAWAGCFWRISVSHDSNFFQPLFFINAQHNLNVKFLQRALLEPTPYWICIPVSSLEDVTQIIFNDSLKQNRQLVSTVD